MKGGLAAAVAASLRFVARGRVPGLDQLSRHRRRGRPLDQRHGQASRLGAREGRTLRSLHRRRADQRRGARRHDQARPARLADRTARPAWPAGPRRLSAYRRQSDPRARAGSLGACSRLRSTPATPTSSRRTSKSSASTSAIRRRTSFPAKSGSCSTSASTTLWTPETLSAEIARRIEAAAGGTRHHAGLRSDQRGRLPDPARAVHRPRRRARSRT